MHDALAAAQELQVAHAISAEVIDLRSLWPWDTATVLASVRKTSRVVIAHEAPRVGGFGGEVAATVAEECFADLAAPVLRLGAPHTPIPFSPPLEQQVRVTSEQIVAAVLRLVHGAVA